MCIWLPMENSSSQPDLIRNLKKVLDKSLEGAVISDMRQEGQPLVYCNDTFVRMTGYEKDEVMGKNCKFLQEDDTQQEGLTVLRSALEKGEACKVVLRNYRKNGELFYNRLSLSPIKNKDGEITHYLGIQDDITDIIALDRKLSEAEKEREVLLSEVHHRVKNNLAVMSSLMELERSGGQEQQLLENSLLRINSMALIHEKLYQKEGLAYLNFADFIKGLVHSVMEDEQDSGIGFDYRLEDVELNVNQAIPLSIIVSELVQNSFQHAYPDQTQGKVVVALEEAADGRVELEIIDFGKGLPDTVDFVGAGTIGFTLVNSLLPQLGAEAELMDGEELGLGVRITFPKSDEPGSSQKFRVGGGRVKRHRQTSA